MANKKQKQQAKHFTEHQKRQVVSAYKDVLDGSQELIKMQTETIKKAIEMRIFNQEIIHLLEQINTSGKLTDTIDNMTKLCREFDELAIEYGPYNKGAYITAVVSRSPLGGEADGKEK